MRILREEICGTCANIREIAAPPARDTNLLANRFRVIDQRDTTPSLPSTRRAKKPRRSGPDNDRVKVLLHAANVAVRYGLLP